MDVSVRTMPLGLALRVEVALRCELRLVIVDLSDIVCRHTPHGHGHGHVCPYACAYFDDPRVGSMSESRGRID